MCFSVGAIGFKGRLPSRRTSFLQDVHVPCSFVLSNSRQRFVVFVRVVPAARCAFGFVSHHKVFWIMSFASIVSSCGLFPIVDSHTSAGFPYDVFWLTFVSRPRQTSTGYEAFFKSYTLRGELPPGRNASSLTVSAQIVSCAAVLPPIRRFPSWRSLRPGGCSADGASTQA